MVSCSTYGYLFVHVDLKSNDCIQLYTTFLVCWKKPPNIPFLWSLIIYHLWLWHILNDTVDVGFISFISSHFVTLISIGKGKPSALFVLSSGVFDISCSWSWSWWCRCLWWNACKEKRLCVCFLPPLRFEIWGLSFLILRVLYICNCV